MNLPYFSIVLLLALVAISCAEEKPHPEPERVEPIYIGSLTLNEIVPGIWMHSTYRNVEGFGRVLSNGLVAISGNDAILIDTPWGDDPNADTMTLLRTIESRTGIRIRHAFLTHYHNDSIGGLETLRAQNVTTLTLDQTADLMDSTAGQPDSLLRGDVGSSWPVTFGEQTAEIFYPGPGHTEDNIVVFFPESGILYGGCLIRPGESDNLGNTADADVAQWAQSVQAIQARYGDLVKTVIPTHGPPHGAELLGHTIDLVNKHIESN